MILQISHPISVFFFPDPGLLVNLCALETKKSNEINRSTWQSMRPYNKETRGSVLHFKTLIISLILYTAGAEDTALTERR